MKIFTMVQIAAISSALFMSLPVLAQTTPSRPAAAARGPVVEPNTQWPGADWARTMREWINGTRVVGKPEIYMINGTGKVLRVECEQKNSKRWTLVGAKPYIVGNPTELPAFQMTEISTKDFDGYCDEVAGYAPNDDRYLGEMSKPKDFSGSAFITFVPKN